MIQGVLAKSEFHVAAPKIKSHFLLLFKIIHDFDLRALYSEKDSANDCSGMCGIIPQVNFYHHPVITRMNG